MRHWASFSKASPPKCFTASDSWPWFQTAITLTESLGTRSARSALNPAMGILPAINTNPRTKGDMNTQYSETNGHTFQAGTLAFVDSFGGLVPCKVVAVSKGGPFPGWIVAQGEISVKVTASRAGYRKGELLTGRAASNIIPRSQVVTRKGQYRIRTNFSWN